MEAKDDWLTEEQTLVKVEPTGETLESDGLSSVGTELHETLLDARGIKGRISGRLARQRKIPKTIASTAIAMAVITPFIPQSLITIPNQNFIVGGLIGLGVFGFLIYTYIGPVQSDQSLSVYLMSDGSQESVVYSAGRRTSSVVSLLEAAYGRSADVTVMENVSLAELGDFDPESFDTAAVGKIHLAETRATDGLCKSISAEELVRDTEYTLPLYHLLRRISAQEHSQIAELTVTPRHSHPGFLDERIDRLEEGSDMTLWYILKGIINKRISNTKTESTNRGDLVSAYGDRIDRLEQLNAGQLFDLNIRYLYEAHEANTDLSTSLGHHLNEYQPLRASAGEYRQDPTRLDRLKWRLRGLHPYRNNPEQTLQQMIDGESAWTSPTNPVLPTAVGVCRENLVLDNEEVLKYLLIPGNDDHIIQAMDARPPSQRPGHGPGEGRIEPLRGDDW